MLNSTTPSSVTHRATGSQGPIVSKKSGGPGIERHHEPADQSLVDKFRSLDSNYINGMVEGIGKGVKVSVPLIHDGNLADTLKAGLEVSGQLVTGIPGAVLKLISINDKTVAVLFPKGSEGAKMLDVDSKRQASLTNHTVTLPDGSELYISATSDARKIHLHRSVDDASLSTEFEKSEKGYQLAGLTLSRDSTNATLSATGLNTDNPESYLSQSDALKHRVAKTTRDSAEVSSKPRYTDDFQAMESAHATLDKLTEAGISVYGGTFNLT